MSGRFIVFIFMLLPLFNVPYAQHIDIEKDREQLAIARELIWNFSSEDKIFAILGECKSHFNSLADTCERLFWLSNTEFLYGMVQMGKDNKLLAIQNFEAARNMVTQALQCRTFIDGYALLSEIYVQLMWCKGLVYQLKNIDKMRDVTIKALSLDPNNIKARQSLAVYYINAPQVLGGNINKAIELLSNIDAPSKTEQFATYYILGNAYTRNKDFIYAVKYFQLALSLFPQNRWALEDLEAVNQTLKHSPRSLILCKFWCIPVKSRFYDFQAQHFH